MLNNFLFYSLSILCLSIFWLITELSLHLISEVMRNEFDSDTEAKIHLQYIKIWLAVLELSFNKK